MCFFSVVDCVMSEAEASGAPAKGNDGGDDNPKRKISDLPTGTRFSGFLYVVCGVLFVCVLTVWWFLLCVW